MSKVEIRRGRAHDDALKDAYFAKVEWPWWRRAWDRVGRFLRELFR
jgi:hypothetical protein